MPCYHPLLALLDFEKSKRLGFAKFHFRKDADLKLKNADYYRELVKSGFVTKFVDMAGVPHQDMLVPCRQCIGCRLEYSRQWANRLMIELGNHNPDMCWFVTFTYENEPVNKNGYQTLVKRDVQLFNKRLRYYLGEENTYMYYIAGEYGEQTFRPHYHGILFDVPLQDLKFLKNTASGPLFTSKFLDDCWSLGDCYIAHVEWSDCAYTARYMTKKLKGERALEYDAFDVQKEFALMSKNPPIASRDFSVENFSKGILRYVNGRSINVPDAWKRYMRGCDLESYADVKSKKNMLALLNATQTTNSDYLPSENLKINEIETILQKKRNKLNLFRV